ncbi:hypothetical protein [Bacillus thuringiensis]|uniref:hypothetical protein n=1 Tax=Bacillus thuringiensis TaxID=1428 RepID=UPI0011A0E2BC|nr:hypothetical protein [Bacillus thuringiensis]
MELIIIDNKELAGKIDDITDLLTIEQKENFRIIPKTIEYNFGNIQLWFEAIAAAYTVIQIIEKGVDIISSIAKRRDLKYKNNDKYYEVNKIEETNKGYIIYVDNKEVQISVNKNNKSYMMKIENIEELIKKK